MKFRLSKIFRIFSAISAVFLFFLAASTTVTASALDRKHPFVYCSETTPPVNSKPASASIDWRKFYAEECASLTLDQIYTILDLGRELAARTDMIKTLSEEGSAIFPHCSILKCGDQVAAVVDASLEACIKTGKNQILLLGVLHGSVESTGVLLKARRQERPGEVVSHPCRRIFGPELPNNELLNDEFSLDNFIFLLKHAAKRKGIQVPNLVLRYPYMIQGQLATVPGIEELQQLAKESILVTTSDLFHYGTAYYYGASENKKIPISQEGYDFAYKTVEKNLEILFKGDLLAYIQYCDNNNSDSRNVGQILLFLLGQVKHYIRYLRLVDVSSFFDKPPPNWVAATLVELQLDKIQQLESGDWDHQDSIRRK